ncbi:MAG TPA: ribosome-associated translation inhibitor RaiA [Bryobacteraceae bacterium]|jgi:putative sigma-54 modulation protein|nr:ribosome-associated translation inhibitor RaiA [Bryobacteraceae bacterium]
MKITYTGRQVELAPAQLKKLEARFSKIGKLLSGKKECEAHVILSLERHLHHAEATLRYFNQQLVGLGSSSDLFEAIHGAAEKLEKQAVKARTKWRDNKRSPRQPAPEEAAPPPPPAKKKKVAPEPEPDRLIYHVENHKKRKPMTLEEAMLEMDGRDYLVYRDAKTERMVMLVRRKDGHFDMVEA